MIPQNIAKIAPRRKTVINGISMYANPDEVDNGN